MKRISDIEPLGEGRSDFSAATREKLRLQRLQQEKDLGFQQLIELCNLGECDMAKQLAAKHYSWGYEIINGIVTERID